jgi:hypothetical protein
MGWERGRYYTRSRKVSDRVVREYVGGGEVGELVAQMDAIEREQREMDREADEATRDELAAEDQPLGDLDALADEAARAAMLVAGYRRHKRGEWRKKRVRPGEGD